MPAPKKITVTVPTSALSAFDHENGFEVIVSIPKIKLPAPARKKFTGLSSGTNKKINALIDQINLDHKDLSYAAKLNHLKAVLKEVDRALILEALEQTDFRISRAGQRLGTHRNNVYLKAVEYKIPLKKKWGRR